MKIGIYAACKNELKHLDDWYNSCKDADIICVADTGSTDGTREKLNSFPKVKVTDMRIIPWRFDFAFNFAMALLPDNIDVCIRLDQDERLSPNWRTSLEESWTDKTTRLRYPYIWNWNSDGTPGRRWYGDRIHSRVGYYWIGQTHEGLIRRDIGYGEDYHTFTDKFEIWQYPDAKSKKQDLALLQEATKEYPHDVYYRSHL